MPIGSYWDDGQEDSAQGDGCDRRVHSRIYVFNINVVCISIKINVVSVNLTSIIHTVE